jgi:hypothetical protein
MRTVTSVTMPLRAGDDAEEIVAAGIEMTAAEPHNLASHQRQLAAEHVVGGHAVFETVHAAGILRHVAADGAGDLRRRIGRVIEAGVLHRLADGEIGDARLDDGDPVVEIKRADVIELGHAEKDGVAERQRAPRQRGARPARDHLDALGMTETEHGRDLFGGFRQHDHHRKLAIGGEAIALVRPHGALHGDDPLAGDHALERRNDFSAAGEHVRIRERQGNRHHSLSAVSAIILADHYSRKRA